MPTVIWMFFHSGVYTFSSCVFFKSYAKVSACLPNIVVVTAFISYVIHQPALVLFRCFVLGLDQQTVGGIKGFVECGDVIVSALWIEVLTTDLLCSK